jgi:AraC family transcriptional regulator of arabinose operon
MPKAVEPMSNPDFRSPFTPRGIPLGDETKIGLPTLRIEECGFEAKGLSWNFEGVVSPFWRLYWNARNGSALVVAGRRIILKPSAVLLVPEGLRFDTRGEKGTPHLWLHFTVFPHRRYGTEGPAEIHVNAQVRASLQALMRCVRSKSPPYIYFHHAHALLHAALAEFPGFHRSRLPGILENLLDYIHAHIGGELDNAFLARFCHRSTEGFIRWFRAHLKIPPQKYVSECRVRQAARELAVTEDSIDRIAERNGFPNRNYFTRVFALTTGVPPASFRAKSWRRPDQA